MTASIIHMLPLDTRIKISEFLILSEIFVTTLFREACGPSISGSNRIRYPALGDFERENVFKTSAYITRIAIKY
jgi:hypothetical protein